MQIFWVSKFFEIFWYVYIKSTLVISEKDERWTVQTTKVSSI